MTCFIMAINNIFGSIPGYERKGKGTFWKFVERRASKRVQLTYFQWLKALNIPIFNKMRESNQNPSRLK